MARGPGLNVSVCRQTMPLQTERWQVGLPLPDGSSGHVLIHYRQAFLQQDNGKLLWPMAGLQKRFAPWLLDVQGIGYLNGQPVFLFELDNPPDDDSWQWSSLRSWLADENADWFHMLAYASQIGIWSRQHRFCGSCGQPMQSSAEHRMRFCQPCRLEQYPRLSPCMIVLVTRGDELLLGRSPRFVSGMYSCLAGYAEPGETMEGCVHREVFEETRVRVHNLRYIASQNWPFPHSMMMGFHADYLDGDIVPEKDEIEDARWFSIHQLPGLPLQGSIARYLIDLYLHQRLGGDKPVLPC